MADVVIVRDLSIQIVGAIDDAVKAALLDAAQAIASEAQESIRSRPKTGRTYRHPGGGSYVASAPGEPPANVTGALADSITAQPEGEGASVTVTNAIAHTMEFGTAGGKIAPRPFLTPSVEAKRAQIDQMVATQVRARIGT